MSADADAREAHIGRTAIEEMFHLWQVDEERAEWREDEEGLGFDWWPGDFTVQVRDFGAGRQLRRERTGLQIVGAGPHC